MEVGLSTGLWVAGSCGGDCVAQVLPLNLSQPLDKCGGVLYLVTCWRERPTNHYRKSHTTMSLLIILPVLTALFIALKGIK